MKTTSKESNTMKKALLIIAALTLLVTSANADILWDQSAIDPVNYFMNSHSAGVWGTVIVYAASDIHVPVEANITSITTYYSNTGQWMAGSYPAVVDIYMKTGATPVTGTDDPLVTGIATTADLVDVGNGVFELRATGLNLPMIPGDYWIVLTPEIPDGPSFREFQFHSTDAWGDNSCSIEFGGWMPPSWASNGMEGALTIEADLTVATEEASWGQFKAIYR
jgi:hypothetical protein